MSSGYLWMIGARVHYRQRPDHNRNVDHTLTMEVRKYLVVDNRRIVEVVAEEIETCLESPQGITSDSQEVYSVLKWWYQLVSWRQPHPYRTNLEKLSGKYADLKPAGRPTTPWPARTKSCHTIWYWWRDTNWGKNWGDVQTAEEEQVRRSYPPVVRTPAGMSEGGLPCRELFRHPQPNLMAENGRTNPVHVVERVYTYWTRVDSGGTDPKGKHG